MAMVQDTMEAWSELLGQLYQAVLEPTRLPGAMALVCSWLDADEAHFIGWDSTRLVPRFAAINQWSLAHDMVDPDYVSRYHLIDPRWQKLLERPLGEVARCSDVFDDAYVSRSEFFQDFLLPRGRRYSMGARLYLDHGLDFYGTFYRSVGRQGFNDQDAERSRLLVPHLTRLAKMLVQHEALAVAAELGESSLNTLDQGVLVLDAHGELLFANQRAEALLRQSRWLSVQHKKVRPAVGPSGPFESALARVMADGVPDGLILRSSDPSPGLWCSVSIIKVCPQAQRGITAMYPRARLLLHVTVPNGQRSVTAAHLMQLFGLTQAEARLAQSLVRGHSVDDYARQHGLALPTVRTQVRAVLDKTDAQRQQDLVRMLAGLPSARSPVGH